MRNEPDGTSDNPDDSDFFMGVVSEDASLANAAEYTFVKNNATNQQRVRDILALKDGHWTPRPSTMSVSTDFVQLNNVVFLLSPPALALTALKLTYILKSC